ncbi:MAG TPA: hypothetical protein VJ808_11670 [Gemmatimonadales bacterium]|nr:hypothetical protein [Gemmatimonadales bacterium]
MTRTLAVLVFVAVAGCGSATTRTTPAEGPAPEPSPAATPPGVPEPTGVIYRAVENAAFTIERHDTLALQLPGGASQQQLIDRSAYVNVTLVPDTGGYQVTIVLDSLQASAGGVPAALDSLVPAWGTRWTGTLTANGELSALKADRSTTFGDQVGASLRSLFPTLPPGGVRAGMEWADTIDVPIRADAFNATERGITSYRAVDSDDPKARKAIKLESNGSYDRTGKGMQFEQQLEMSASGTRSAVHYLSEDGFVISARGSEAGDMTITVPAVGQTVPVKQGGSYMIDSTRPAKR